MWANIQLLLGAESIVVRLPTVKQKPMETYFFRKPTRLSETVEVSNNLGRSLPPPPPNLAGIHQANKEDINQAISTPYVSFIYWLTDNHSIDLSSQKTLRQAFLNNKWCQKVVKLFTLSNFPQIERDYCSNRQRKQRTGKNSTRDAKKEERRIRAKFKLIVYNLLSEEDTCDVGGIYSIQTIAEQYYESLHKWIGLAKKSILNTNPNVKEVANLKSPPQYKLLMLNDTTVTWSDVITRLLDHSENMGKRNRQYTLMPTTLLRLAKLIRGNQSGTSLNLSNKSDKQRVQIINAVCIHLPVLAILQKDDCALFDLHQLTLPDWMEIINADTIHIKETQRQARTESSLQPRKNAQDAVGAIPLHIRFPNLVPVVVQFVQQNGVSAEKRRRHTTATVGVGLEDIRKHVLTEIPLIANWGLSVDTVARLFMAPHDRKNSRVMYKNLIEARTPGKDDTLRKGNANQHAAACQLKMIMEMAFDYRDDCVAFSADDKAQVSIGKMCVSKFVKFKNKYPVGDAPISLDHTFVIASCWSLTVSGLLEITPHPLDFETDEDMVDRIQADDLYDEKEQHNIFRMAGEDNNNVMVTTQARRRRRAIMRTYSSDSSNTDIDLLSTSGPLNLNTGGNINTGGTGVSKASEQNEAECSDDSDALLNVKHKPSGRLRRSHRINQSSSQESPDNKSSNTINFTKPTPPTKTINPPRLVLDRHNRQHIDVPTSGKSHLFIRPTKTNASCPYTHYKDLMTAWKRNPKPNVVLSVDGGSDYTCRSVKNLYWYGKFFKEANLDTFNIVQNAAYYSAYNHWIEHHWAWCSQNLIGVELTGTLPSHDGLTPGEYHKIPACTKECQQNRKDTMKNLNLKSGDGLTKDIENPQKKRARTIRATKVRTLQVSCLPECLNLKNQTLAVINDDEAKVFQNASEELKDYWHGKEWDTHKVDCQVISDLIPHDVRDEIRHLDRYHKCIDRKKFLSGAEFYEMHQFYLWMFAHLPKKHTHNIAFAAKCGRKRCEHKRCHESGTNMGNAMRDSNMPCNPTKGPLDGHFHTYLEHKSQGGKKQDRPDKYIQLEKKNHDTYLPVVCPFQGQDNASCGKSYIASSKTEAANHAKKYHPRGLLKQRQQRHWVSMVKKGRAAPYTKKVKKPSRKRYLYRCTHMDDSTAKVYCNRSFKSHRLLKEHQKNLQHKNQGRQKSPHPGSSRSQRTTTEKKKKERQMRVDLRKKRAKRLTLTRSVDPKGNIGTNGTSRISGQHKQQSESEQEISLLSSEEEERSEEDNGHSKGEDHKSNVSGGQGEPEIFGACVSKCIANYMAAVQTFYDDGRRGMELFKIVKMTSKTPGQEMYQGILYTPDDCSNTDPNCVRATWTRTNKKETAHCWTVSLYFPKMIGPKGKKIPANIIREIEESYNFFGPSSSPPTPSSPRHVSYAERSNKEQLSNVTNVLEMQGNRAASNGTNGKQKYRVHFSKSPSRELNSSPSLSDTDKIQSQEGTPKYGADVSQCIPKSMAVVETKYDNGQSGIEVYKVLKMTVQTTGSEEFSGRRYLPSKGLTSDVMCLKAAWYPTKEIENVMCWSVTLYFRTFASGFGGKKRLPVAVRKDIQQKVFDSCIKSNPVGSSETTNMELSGEAKQARKRARSRSSSESDSDTVPVHINIIDKSSLTTITAAVSDAVVSAALETEDTSAVCHGGANAPLVTKSVLSESDRDCMPGHFMICIRDFLDGKGIDLYKIKSVSDQTIQGVKHVPMTSGQRTTDPMCLKGRWRNFRFEEEVPRFAVIVCFHHLNKDGTIPHKIRSVVVLHAAFEDKRPAPVQIVKTRISFNTQLTQYLMEFEDRNLLWMEEGQVQKKELQDWLHRHSKSAENDGKNEALNQDWLSPISSNQLLIYDKQMISDGGPLNQVIVDVSMAILAAQTSLFEMQSCVQPVAGYTRPQRSVHLHVHHCGRKENHFVSSVYAKNEIWFLDYNQKGDIPPIVITALIDMYMPTDEDHAVKILRLPQQKRQHTCGILSIAAVVEIALSDNAVNDPSSLTTVVFDEAKAPEWLISCLTNGQFVSCPIVVTNSSALSSSASSTVLAYSTMAVTSHFLTRVRVRRPVADKRQGIPHGSGNTKVDECYTSNGQKASRRLLVGCTINMESRDNSPNGLYVVLDVNPELNVITIEPLNPLAFPRKIDIHSAYAFCIIGPPSLRYTELDARFTTDFRLSAPNKIMIIYPVSNGHLSNTLFDSHTIHEYSVIEAEPCATLFDVECLLRFLSRKQINLQVRIVDLFPINCLASFYPFRPDLKQLKKLYVTVLECLFEEHHVAFEMSPFVSRRITDYPVGVFTVASKLPPFQYRVVQTQYRQIPERIKKKKVGAKIVMISLDAGSENVFSDPTWEDIHEWAWSTANTELPNKPNITVECSSYVENSLCCLCYVVNHKIIRNDAGNQLTNEQFLLLEESCNTFVHQMETYYYIQLLDKDSDKEGAKDDSEEWSQLGDPQWGGYRIKMYLDEGIPTIVDVKGIHAHYDTKLNSISNDISLGGLVNFGGQKLVLAATFRGNLLNEDVVIILPRYSECAKSKQSFQLELTMMSVMDKSPNGVQIMYEDKVNCWAMLERLDGTIEEYISKFKWNTLERRTAIIDVLLKSSRALAAVHAKSVVHRDVKPDNFLYKESFENREPKLLVKIADFGLAMFVSGESGDGVAGATGDVGTSSYKAPEVINGQPYGQKADVYSMGISLFELVYWQRRFTILRRGLKKQKTFKDIEKYAASIPTPDLTGQHGKEIDDLIRLCTAQKATSRPTMPEVVNRLEKIILTVRAVPPPKKKRLVESEKKTKNTFASVFT